MEAVKEDGPVDERLAELVRDLNTDLERERLSRRIVDDRLRVALGEKKRLRNAAQRVIDMWPTSDLANAVNMLREELE